MHMVILQICVIHDNKATTDCYGPILNLYVRHKGVSSHMESVRHFSHHTRGYRYPQCMCPTYATKKAPTPCIPYSIKKKKHANIGQLGRCQKDTYLV